MKRKKNSRAVRSRLGPLRAIGEIKSVIKNRADAPKQGSEGAPHVRLHVDPSVAQALHGLKAGDEIIVITWLHKGRRDVLKVHLRSKKNRALTGDSQRDLLTARTRWAFTR